MHLVLGQITWIGMRALALFNVDNCAV